MNTKLHALCNGEGKPLAFVLTEGQVSDYKDAKLLLNSLPQARELVADRGYDAGWFRDALMGEASRPASLPKGTENSLFFMSSPRPLGYFWLVQRN